MKPYLLSCAVGIFVGIIYGLLDVKSPAPPVVALVGLLGMLGGEQVAKVVRDHYRPTPSATARSGALRQIEGQDHAGKPQ